MLAVAFRPDGKRLLAAGDELVVCDAISGEVLVRVPQSARGRMSSVCYAPDGRRMVSAGGTPVLWDADTGQELMSLGGGARGTNGHAPDWPYQVYALAFSPDGGRIVTGDASGELRLLDSRTGHEITRLSGPGNRVLSVAFRPDGRRIVAAAGNALVAWDAVSGKRTLTIHDGTEVRCAAFPPDGRWILAGGRHGLTVRDARADKCPLLLDFRHEEKDRTWCVVFSPDGTLMATGRMDGAITVWDTATGEELMSLPRLEESFSSVAGITNSSDV